MTMAGKLEISTSLTVSTFFPNIFIVSSRPSAMPDTTCLQTCRLTIKLRLDEDFPPGQRLINCNLVARVYDVHSRTDDNKTIAIFFVSREIIFPGPRKIEYSAPFEML